MNTQHGNLSINSDNIFPIIKKWMYSDKDIFIRELISNASDAITKRKKLDAIGEAELPEGYKAAIHVEVNDKEKTLSFSDNGIGMTADEVIKDITEIAFSGATEFVEKYKGKTDEDQIIGHFGLGFYSAFMVADQVDIDTLSFTEGAEPVHWECDGGTEYDMKTGTRTEVGTTVTLHLNEDSLEFANEYKVREILEKYCSFMPVEIFLKKADAEPPKEGEEPKSISDIHPLWTKQPSECTDEQYKEFYRHVFLDYKEPLFWIHLNMDYPFNLKGILYFPRINTEYDSVEGKIKLYNNQVFIADNIKEVIPEYLMLLKGVIDCPDLPLNVSRSALQNDGFVTKISQYISKKVADKLSGMYKTDRENYEKYWNDISPFIKYGFIKDRKFSDKMKDYVLYENLDGKYLTLQDCLDENRTEEQKAAIAKESEDKKAYDALSDEDKKKADEEKNKAEEAKSDEDKKAEADARKVTIYYVTDPAQQSQYIKLFRSQGKDAVLLRHNIDQAFIQHIEQVNDGVHFQRIDSDVTEDLKDGDADIEKENTVLTELFRKALKNDKLNVKAESLKDENISSMITLSEESRRYADMMRMYGMSDDAAMSDMFAAQSTLVLNVKNPLVKYIFRHKNDKEIGMICEQLYDLAMISNRPLSSDEMTKFVERSNKIMLKLSRLETKAEKAKKEAAQGKES
ncbi:MAG: molecular chaperone HtpG [Eubacterium sp.]|nr:molecular chaperone HtpG [Eubacterium sp.]